MREMILSQDETQRTRALAKLLPMQRADFEGIFRAMDGLPVTIRLLDPPLHEFLPQEEKDFSAVAEQLGISVEALRFKAMQLHEFNPMLGHRGCRLAISYPQVAQMQTRAILEGALLAQADGMTPVVEIMVPLIAHEKELALLKETIQKEAEAVFTEKETRIDYLIGTMIELPRAALTADAIAEHAQFFSFSAPTISPKQHLDFQMDDSNSFLPSYVEKAY